MYKRPLLTIITITFNLYANGREKTFVRCVKSVKSQTNKNIEHLIIDGGSIDETSLLLKKYQKQKLIRYISEPDNGVYDAMNKGIKLAKGEYILFLNSDDYLYGKNNLNKALTFIKDNHYDLIYTDVKEVDAQNNKVFGIWRGNLNRLVFGTHFCHQGVIATKTILSKYLFDTTLKVSADSDQINRMVANKESVAFCPYSFAAYRSGGFSNLNPEINRREHAYSFYKNIGKKYGLNKKDCYMLWNFSLFFELPIKEALMYCEKLKNKKWQYEFLLQFFKMVKSDQIKLTELTQSKENYSLTEKKIILMYRKIKHLIFPKGSLLFIFFNKFKNN